MQDSSFNYTFDMKDTWLTYVDCADIFYDVKIVIDKLKYTFDGPAPRRKTL